MPPNLRLWYSASVFAYRFQNGLPKIQSWVKQYALTLQAEEAEAVAKLPHAQAGLCGWNEEKTPSSGG